MLEAGLPKVQDELRILSPFDNAVIQRDRLKSLFGFDYQIECYVPAAKRRYGYFALPLLYRGDFVGRMDCKVHRSEQHLHIKGTAPGIWEIPAPRPIEGSGSGVGVVL